MTITNTLGAQELSYLSSTSASQGYQLLNGQLKTAVTNFEQTPQAQSDINYFETNVAKISTVAQFVANPKLVDFVLSAFGLDSQSNYQALVNQVLTQDPNNANSLVNQLTDPRFKQMATALDFYDDGLSRLQAIGSGTPNSATSAEGITLSPLPSSASSTSSAPVSTATILTPTTSVNTNVTVGIGVQFTGNQYFAVQEPSGSNNSIGISVSGDQYIPVDTPGTPATNVNITVPRGQYLQVTEADGSTGYTQGGTFSIDTNNQLSLSDGSVLQPPVTLPSDTTGVTVDASGNISVTQSGTSGPTVVGQLQTSTFTDPTQLSTDDNGYYTPTDGSGAAVGGTPTGTIASYGVTGYVQSGTFTLNSSNQLALPDGTLLAPPVTFPAGTTSVNIDSSGNIDAYASAGATPTVVGTLQTASFDSSDLQQSGGYYVPTSGTAIPTPASASNFQTYGATGYAQTGYFTINPNNNLLQLADGSTLYPPVSIPSGATSLSIDSSGVISAVIQGQTGTTPIATLQAYTFSNPSQLTTDADGYSQPSSGSGSATAAQATSFNSFGATNQVQTTYTITKPSNPAAAAAAGAISVGLGLTGSDYLIIQKPDGSTAYAKSGVFSINSSNQLALPDGSLLYPPVILPTDTTAVTVSSSGTVYAQEKGQTSPTNVGTLETATFAKPSALTKDSSGYLIPNSTSGAANDGPVQATSYAFSNTIQGLVNQYVTNEFEVAVGANNSAVREALYFQRTIGPDEASAGGKAATQADVILGDSVLDDVAEVALGEPKQLAYQSIASQEQIMESGIQLNQLQNTKYVAQFTARYLAESDATTGGVASSDTASTPNAALSILQSYASGSSSSSSSGIASLFSASA